MVGRNKGFLNLNRLKASKAIKRQMKYGIKMGKVDKINRSRRDGSRGCGDR